MLSPFLKARTYFTSQAASGSVLPVAAPVSVAFVAVVAGAFAAAAESAADAAVLSAASLVRYFALLLSDLLSAVVVLLFAVPFAAGHKVCPVAVGTFDPASSCRC